MADYALYSAGGRIILPMTSQISITDLDKFYSDNPQPDNEKEGFIDRFFNFFITRTARAKEIFPDPSNVIKDSLQPGDCWAFLGQKGNVTIKLAKPIQITHVTIDHTHPLVAHQKNSAPKHFKVWGWGLDLEEHSFLNKTLICDGSYNFGDAQIQTFPALKSNQIFRYVTLEIHSNYGNPHYTCVYRFRVHSYSE